MCVQCVCVCVSKMWVHGQTISYWWVIMSVQPFPCCYDHILGYGVNPKRPKNTYTQCHTCTCVHIRYCTHLMYKMRWDEDSCQSNDRPKQQHTHPNKRHCHSRLLGFGEVYIAGACEQHGSGYHHMTTRYTCRWDTRTNLLYTCTLQWNLSITDTLGTTCIYA